MLTISIIVIASILAIVILIFLLKSTLPQNKKQSILLLLGLLIFASVIISNIKSKKFQFNLFSSHTVNRINNAFYEQQISYKKKYLLDERQILDIMRQKNYGKIEKKEYQQKIIFISKKNEGASFFMFKLAQGLRYQGIPVFYIKLQSSFNSYNQILRKTGIPSAQAFQKAIQTYCQNQNYPYIIIDNIQRLSVRFWQSLKKLNYFKRVSFIFNTQTQSVLNSIVDIINDEDWFSQFQIQRWKGPDRQILQKLSPTNSYLKKLPIDFKVISSLHQGVSEQQISLRSSNSYSNVANYFGFLQPLNILKRKLQFGQLNFSQLKQLKIPFQKIQEMQKLGLIKIQNGLVKLK